jgi:hypothetical protein
MAARPEAGRRAVARNDALALARLSAALRSHEHGGTFLSRTGGIVKLTKIPLSERRKEISQLRSGWSAWKKFMPRGTAEWCGYFPASLQDTVSTSANMPALCLIHGKAQKIEGSLCFLRIRLNCCCACI